MQNILVLYYSQTGQLKNIVDSIVKSWIEDESITVDFVKYKPVQDYPFPWTSDAFFDVFPEAREGITCPMQTLNLDQKKHYDLVIFAYQVWYLSPSVPAWSILNHPELAPFLNQKKVITVLGVRNMWVQAHKRVHQQLLKLNAKHVGNIVLSDPTNNFLSVITVIRWLIDGKQEATSVWPRSGVPLQRIKEAQKYGQIIKDNLTKNTLDNLQEQLYSNGAVDLDFVQKTIEHNGFRIFGLWSKFILKKGSHGDKKRLLRVRLFKYYLLFMIFILSPLGSLLFWIINIVFYPFIQLHLRKVALMNA